MNKELSPLEAFERIVNHCESDLIINVLYDYEKEIKIVKKALKRQDSIEITAIDIEQDNKALCKENKKLKRVLEIIKEKSIDVHSFLIGINLNTYEDFIQKGRKYGWYTNEPTKEEYDLLKEVLL